MGKRPKLAHGEGKAPLAASVSSPMHGEELLSEGVKSSPAISLMLAELVEPLAEKVPSLPLSPSTIRETVESQPKRKAKSTNSTNSWKFQKQNNGEVRRSVRLQNAVVRSTNLQPGFEDLTSDDDGNSKGLQLPEVGQELSLRFTEKNLEAKLDWLVKQVEALQGSMKALESKVAQELNLSGCTRHADADGITLHLDCRKKIDELMNANRDLTLKLKDAQNKLELYEKGQQLFSEVLDKLKDIILLFDLSKAAGR